MVSAEKMKKGIPEMIGKTLHRLKNEWSYTIKHIYREANS